jgi:hypothetical protein
LVFSPKLNNETAYLLDSLTVTHPGLYILKHTTSSPTGGVNQLMPKKYQKVKEKKGENVKQKGRKRKDKEKFQLTRVR